MSGCRSTRLPVTPWGPGCPWERGASQEPCTDFRTEWGTGAPRDSPSSARTAWGPAQRVAVPGHPGGQRRVPVVQELGAGSRVLQCQGRVSLTCPMLQPAADSKSLVPLITLAFPLRLPGSAHPAPGRLGRAVTAAEHPASPAGPGARALHPRGSRLRHLSLGTAGTRQHRLSTPDGLSQGAEGLIQPWGLVAP